MRLQIYAGYFADTQLYNEWCAERAKTDPFFAKCYRDWFNCGELAMESYARRKKFPWRRGLSVNYLPHQKNERGDIDESQRHIIFAFRDLDYDGFLADFSRWDVFEETDTDREYKTQIEQEIGLKLGAWTIVSFVGMQGIFYDFSPGVVAAILERMRERYRELEEAKSKLVVKVKEENPAMPKKQSKTKKSKSKKVETTNTATPIRPCHG